MNLVDKFRNVCYLCTERHDDKAVIMPHITRKIYGFSDETESVITMESKLYGPYERQIFYYETDCMGIVHHSNYIRWFEEARVWLLKEVGIPYHSFEAKGILIPVLSVTANYRKAFTYGDTFQVFLKCSSFNGIRWNFEYEVRNAKDGELYTDGKSSHCFVNKELSPINLKKVDRELYDTLTGIIQSKAKAE